MSDDAVQREREMQEHEREARERDPDERTRDTGDTPAAEQAGGGEDRKSRDGEGGTPAPPGTVGPTTGQP
ncbi:MAG TPA: hypothetical protein VM266_09170 [Solirubrobacteraceae bacterium]|nr:hypothetical protein [Solirubrobacteraceae bacterium]